MQLLKNYEEVLLAALGAIQADKVLHSKESSRVIRDLSKELGNLGVGLRKELILLDKTLTIAPTDNV